MAIAACPVPPDRFEQHCAWLVRHRRVFPLAEATRRLDASGRLPPGMTALTFDDGFSSLHQYAFPTLYRQQLPTTVFLVAETLTPQGRVVDWIRPPPVQPPETLSRDQVLEMQAAGIEFMSHSYSHLDLDTLTEEQCVDDLRTSRELLEDLLRAPVPFLAYPRGRHNARVRRAAARAGYTHAFSLPVGPETAGALAIPRVGIYPANGVRTLQVKLSRRYLPLRMSRAFPVVQSAVRRLRR